MAVSALRLLAMLEEATPQLIGSQFPLKGLSYLEWLTRMRAQREEHLRNLPLEQRRAWERRMGLEGE